MKKYFTIIFIVLAFCVSAQLSLTKSINEPVLGDVNTKQIFDSVGVVPKTMGANQIWDFSGFTINSKVEVSNYISTSAAGGASYTGSNLVESFDQTKFFMKETPTTYEIVGIENPNFKLNFSNNTAIEFIWPVAMGYSSNDAFSGSVNANNLTGTVSGNISTIAQGSGTLIIPGGTAFNNVLQVEMRLTANASFAFGLATADLKVVDYTYYDSLRKFPLLTVSYFNATGAYTANSAAIKVNYSLVGINDYNSESASTLFPNPANSLLTISGKNAISKIELLNSTGQLLLTESVNNKTHQLQLQNFEEGIYFVKIGYSNGKNGVTKKIVVNR